jgi:hypothetical protein
VTLAADRRKHDAGDWGGGFDEHRRRQLLRFALDSTPAERLAWLEEMMRLARRTGALPRRRAGRLG